MCEKCANCSERFRFDEREFLGLLEQLKRLVENKTFDEDADDISLEYASDRKNCRWRIFIHHIFVPKVCRRRIELRFETLSFTWSWQPASADIFK
jgi:hypothetical protein